MTTTRVTTYSYDFRGRRIATDGEVDFYEKRTYDNLDRVTRGGDVATDETKKSTIQSTPSRVEARPSVRV